MITINQNHQFQIENILFVFALEMEAAEVFNEQNTLFVGVGKVNATYELTKAIHQKKPDLIVNLGSAGSSAFKKGDVVCCTQFVQRDMDVSGLGYERYVTPYTNIPSVLQYGLQMEQFPLGVCGTGDNFEMGHTETKYDVVDMEAYAIATIAMKEKIPFLCLKYISDGADDNAAEDWPVLVHKAALAFGEIFQIG
ncbi:5'-methylthioadenosine/S-adenosylhomocysteine nucleosidase family protein [Flavobacterium daejeonense]|uniref:5'-methylthioadenosine/S-adenosylhomocysteine nucleosidase family protein n=1 Tax=Flavobacterium daejeonense TaxID=350893 RepID=UPI0004796DEA|nr:nucleosidase [Flavobacterium daejeonense]